jgi:hypothetical protein
MQNRLFTIAAGGVLAATIVCVPCRAIPESRGNALSDSQTSGNQAVLGIWRCDMNGLPAVTLTVTDEGGPLTGAVLFYLHRREPGQAEIATPGSPEPLMSPRFDGTTFTFQVSHRRAHPPNTLQDAPITFRMKLVSANKAELINVDESEHDPHSPVYTFTRSDY